MRHFLHRSFVFLLLLSLLVPIQTYAQEDEGSITLNVRRIFGFRLMNRIQGRYSFSVDGPDNLEKVEILMDGEVVYELTGSPFKVEFSTAEFPPGVHSFRAIGYTEDGKILQSEPGEYAVLSAEEAQEGLGKYFLPLIIGIIVLIALAGIFSGLITGRRGKYRIGEYGTAGGAICKRCGFPFSRHILSPNLVIGKLERCPHCGAVAIVRRGSPTELQEAEQRILTSLQGVQEDRVEMKDERLKRMIDDSRYEDL
jgi:hypothetical protein